MAHEQTILDAVEMANIIEVGTPDDMEEGEFDHSDWDGDSMMSEESFETLQSTTSSVLQHEYENGRRFHHYRYGRYPIPNDDVEQGRESLKHAMTMELTDGKLIFSPIGKYPAKILDLGTGIGQWAIEVGDLYPGAEVVGTDLSPMQPTWIPPNVRFVVDDMEDEWIQGDDFDLIHVRHVLPVVRKPQKVINDAHEHLKMGGWLEVNEFGGEICCDDGTVPPENALRTFMEVCAETCKMYGMSFKVANNLSGPLAAAGFSNVNCEVYKIPIGTWAKDRTFRLIGKYMQIIMVDLMDAMSAKILPGTGMDPEDIQRMLQDAKEELADANRHAYINYYFITAQKTQ